MATMLIQHQVKNFSDWKKVYDSFAGLRASNGELSDTVYQDANDPSKVTLVFKWDSLDRAQKWAQSSELRVAMEKAGVDGLPKVSFLKEI